ncbi:hypothetical protein TREMEDRAFT_64028 [Tremella mesenterica DSM 1558]|uniref:uncharacterized protein n=1 Tax=Tremella mesenterica (strain ATCC 24925 / CBS 8224 / DSM 1558 / NBRC 9311 / NRRL Y-6157 / RJB 2259-6 / UBC 559-6) TaxID=578456 RepID=UPI0003F48FD9|nr:uncharacterized protein TREMEDRAFT_64028 [Tremella mesenterica DSM 1558]EIW68130.1 hypothetical protein TREMEDRAFT_64028 [Tremella mesenterica DSM 1558]
MIGVSSPVGVGVADGKEEVRKGYGTPVADLQLSISKMQGPINDTSLTARLGHVPYPPVKITSKPLSLSVCPSDSLRTAAEQTPNFPRLFVTGNSIFQLLENILPNCERILTEDSPAKVLIDRVLAKVSTVAGDPTTVRNLGHVDLPVWQYKTYLSPVNEILESKDIQAGMDLGDKPDEVRKWEVTHFNHLTGCWALKKSQAGGKFLPLALIWVQSSASIPSYIFPKLWTAVNRGLITMDSAGKVNLDNHRAGIEYTDAVTTIITRAIEHMFRRLATLRVRVGILTTYDHSLIFHVKNHHIEISRILDRDGASPSNPLGSIMPLFTAISLLKADTYRHDAAWKVTIP